MVVSSQALLLKPNFPKVHSFLLSLLPFLWLTRNVWLASCWVPLLLLLFLSQMQESHCDSSPIPAQQLAEPPAQSQGPGSLRCLEECGI